MNNMENIIRKCKKCGAPLSEKNKGKLCADCKIKKALKIAHHTVRATFLVASIVVAAKNKKLLKK